MDQILEITVRQPTEVEKEVLLIQPLWGCGKGRFDWLYDDKLICMLVAGKATVSYGGKNITIQAGDYVEFPKGLSCGWEILEPVKKHYILEKIVDE